MRREFYNGLNPTPNPTKMDITKNMEAVLLEFEIMTRYYKFSSDHEFVKDRAKQLLSQKTVIE